MEQNHPADLKSVSATNGKNDVPTVEATTDLDIVRRGGQFLSAEEQDVLTRNSDRKQARVFSSVKMHLSKEMVSKFGCQDEIEQMLSILDEKANVDILFKGGNYILCGNWDQICSANNLLRDLLVKTERDKNDVKHSENCCYKATKIDIRKRNTSANNNDDSKFQTETKQPAQDETNQFEEPDAKKKRYPRWARPKENGGLGGQGEIKADAKPTVSENNSQIVVDHGCKSRDAEVESHSFSEVDSVIDRFTGLSVTENNFPSSEAMSPAVTNGHTTNSDKNHASACRDTSQNSVDYSQTGFTGNKYNSEPEYNAEDCSDKNREKFPLDTPVSNSVCSSATDPGNKVLDNQTTEHECTSITQMQRSEPIEHPPTLQYFEVVEFTIADNIVKNGLDPKRGLLLSILGIAVNENGMYKLNGNFEEIIQKTLEVDRLMRPILNMEGNLNRMGHVSQKKVYSIDNGTQCDSCSEQILIYDRKANVGNSTEIPYQTSENERTNKPPEALVVGDNKLTLKEAMSTKIVDTVCQIDEETQYSFNPIDHQDEATQCSIDNNRQEPISHDGNVGNITESLDHSVKTGRDEGDPKKKKVPTATLR